MLLDIHNTMEELRMQQEEKDFEQKNYSAICNRLSMMNKWKLLKELLFKW